MENTYWDNNGRYERTVTMLNELIPLEGTVDKPRTNKALERFRKASNCYYDLYNNGLCNLRRQFTSLFFATSPYRGTWRSLGYYYSEELYSLVEDKMDEIVVAAAKEQGIPLFRNSLETID